MKRRPKKGSLTVVGTGIEAVTHVTRQTQACIERADKVVYGLADPVTIEWICKLNPTAESLSCFYSTEKPRSVTYSEITEHILAYVRKGLHVCAAFYGHPGVYVESGHAAIRQARAEGFSARMLPAISAMDCLYADLGVDPGTLGTQSFGATHFLRHVRNIEPRRPLFLWQVGSIGETKLPLRPCNRGGLRLLVCELRKHYSAGHKVILWVAKSSWGLSEAIEPLGLSSPSIITASTRKSGLPGADAPPGGGPQTYGLVGTRTVPQSTS